MGHPPYNLFTIYTRLTETARLCFPVDDTKKECRSQSLDNGQENPHPVSPKNGETRVGHPLLR